MDLHQPPPQPKHSSKLHFDLMMPKLSQCPSSIVAMPGLLSNRPQKPNCFLVHPDTVQSVSNTEGENSFGLNKVGHVQETNLLNYDGEFVQGNTIVTTPEMSSDSDSNLDMA